MQKFAAVANALYSTSSKRANRCSFVKCCATTQTLGLANAGPWHGLSLETTTFPVSCTQSALRDGLQSSNRTSDSEACYALRDVVGASVKQRDPHDVEHHNLFLLNHYQIQSFISLCPLRPLPHPHLVCKTFRR
jgi:hypothetical protein